MNDMPLSAPQAALPAPVIPARRRYTLAQKLLAAAVLLLSYFYIRMFFFSPAGIGRTLFVFLLLAVSAAYMAHAKIRPNAASIAAGALTGLFSLVFALVPSGMLTFFTAAFCQFGYTYFVYKSMDVQVEPRPGRFFDFDLLKAVFAMPFASFGALFPALFTVPLNGKALGEKKAARTVGLVLLGLLLSVFPTAIAVSLLSFDAGFRAMLDGIFAFELPQFSFFEQAVYIVLALPVAMYIFGLWISGSRGACAGMRAESCARFRTAAHILPRTAVVAACVPVLLVYLLFFIAQLPYFTSAFSGVLPAQFTHAEYARQGFFELCAVLVLNGGLAYLLALFAKRAGKNTAPRVCVALLSAASLILTATAVSKMLLYVDAFGLTLSRVYTLWFMLAAALVFLLLLARVISRRVPFVPLVLAVCTVMFGVLAFSDAPSFVSRCNADRVCAGADWTLDRGYFEQLGASAVPDAVRLESDPAADRVTRSNARRFLDDYTLYHEDGSGLSFNLTEYRARQALRNRVPQGTDI